MQITHEQAQLLLQRKMDQGLGTLDAGALSAHLQNCRDCQGYANEIGEIDRLLIPLLKKHWNRQPAPTSISALIGMNKKTGIINLMTTRKLALSVAALALFFSVWQFVAAGPSPLNQMPQMSRPVPTPSTISTNTLATLEDCEMTLYNVQANDTLSGIADRFLVSVEEIMKINQLQTEVVQPTMKLIIPLCNFTPTGTVHPATFTTTYTPIFQPITFTPDG
jgi:hypothetical protein